MATRFITNLYFTSLFLAPSFLLAKEHNSQCLVRASVFTENKGQIIDQHGKHRSDIDFKAEGDGVVMFVGDAQLHYQWYSADNSKFKIQNSKEDDIPRPPKADTPFEGGMLGSPFQGGKGDVDSRMEVYRMDVELIGANKNAELVTEDKQEYTENYYLPQCPDGATAHSYSRIIYKNVYPNIDWVIYTNSKVKSQNSKEGAIIDHKSSISNELKYDFIVHPGGDYRNIQIRYNGATKIELKDGALVATTPFGSISENAPYTYDADTKKEITSKFVLNGNILSYNIVSHPGDEREVIIDPSLSWASYYSPGGSNTLNHGLCTDKTGNLFMSGRGLSSNLATTGAYQQSAAGGYELYLTKFTGLGQRLWGSFYGGSGDEDFSAIACDPSGNVYICGTTGSSSGIAAAGAFHTSYADSTDNFLAKFSSSGQRLWATYYGGNSAEGSPNVTCDPSGNVYLCATTRSDTGISSSGAHQVARGGFTDLYLAKFNSGGTRLWATYYGGNNHEQGYASTAPGLACDLSGNVYIGGATPSPNGIATAGAHQPVYTLTGPDPIGFLVKFNSSGSRQWGTYYGGHGTAVIAIACSKAGDVYIGGTTGSTTNTASTGAYQSALNGAFDGFLARFNTAGTRQWGTYYGGNDYDYIGGLSISSNDNLFVSGLTISSSGIATGNGYKIFNSGMWDNYISEFSLSGSLLWGSYYGGSSQEGNLYAYTYIHCGMACGYDGMVYMTDGTQSSSGIATTGSFQSSVGSATISSYIAAFAVDTFVHIIRPFTDTLLCAGDSVHINYGVTDRFNSGNIFTLQLSDAAGSFASPLTIGSRTDTIGGIIHGKLPVNTAGGTGYRMRIVTSSPVRTSNDEDADIHIKPVNPGHSATSNSPVCVADTLKLYGGTTGTGVSWSWSGPATYSSGTQNPIRLNATTGYSGNYILTSTYNGCTVTDTAVVVVKSLPSKPTAGSNAPLCPGANLSLTAGSSTSGVSWSWTGPNSYSSSSQNPGRSNMTAADAGNYIVTATLNGCSTKDTETVIVYPVTPKPTAGNNSPLCVSNTLSLTASTISGASYSWGGPAAFTAATQNPARSNMQLNMAGKYYVTATVNGCVSDADTTIVTVNPGPTVNVYPNPNDTVCTGNTVTLVALVTNGGTGPSYQWYKNNNPIAGATLQSCTTTPANGDVYYCKFTPGAGTGCNGAVNSGSITITVLPYTTPSISITATPDTNIWQGLMVNFTATVSNCNNPAYQWKLNGNDISGATSNTWGAATLADNNLVSCVLTCNDMCPNPKNPESNKLRMHVSTGINNTTNTLSTVNIYPNPMQDELHIEGIGKGTRIQLYDVLGREVYNTTTTETTHIISTASLHTGTYILQLTDAAGNRGSYKVVRE